MDFYLIVLAVLVLIILVVFILILKFKDKIAMMSSENRRPPVSFLPKVPVKNDKVVYIEGLPEKEIQHTIQEFCDIYNQHNFQAIVRINTINEESFTITFPFDVEFPIFCYFINFLTYPQHIDAKFKPIGWMSLDEKLFLTKDIISEQPVMIYVDEYDQDYDHVHMVTAEQRGFIYALNEPKENLIEIQNHDLYLSPSSVIQQVYHPKFIEIQ
ncbi:hypothetical protein ACFRAE_12675 [Sphingobacterium sp. HJSM2_6]|uniref:hypothetical protein n=1 Tax=Sphingobacterium sp. HJSM2_6 TaxID=3366264 RepID=UPI003BE2C2A9